MRKSVWLLGGPWSNSRLGVRCHRSRAFPRLGDTEGKFHCSMRWIFKKKTSKKLQSCRRSNQTASHSQDLTKRRRHRFTELGQFVLPAGVKQFLSQHDGVISLTCPGACRCRKCQLWSHRAQVLTSLQWSEELEALERLSAALICFQDSLQRVLERWKCSIKSICFVCFMGRHGKTWEDMGQFFLYNFVACRHWPIKMIGRNSPQLTSCLEIFHMYKEAVTFAVTRHFTALSGALSMKKCRRANVFKLPSSGLLNIVSVLSMTWWSYVEDTPNMKAGHLQPIY